MYLKYMNLKMKNKLPGLALAALLVVSCATPRKMSILLDMQENTPYPAPPAPELVLHKEDKLGIQVLSENPQLASPFNAGLSLVDASAAAQKMVSYVIDRNGNIDFPVLGLLKMEGKTLREARELIAGSIREKGYIKDPVVNVELQNFKVTVMGSLGNNVLTVGDSSINLLQVLARSGGITHAANIKKVTVIRTVNDTRTAYTVNLQKKDLFDSPVFYLQQNDIVYVKPKGAVLSSEGQATLTVVGTGLTLASIITNVLIWSNRNR